MKGKTMTFKERAVDLILGLLARLALSTRDLPKRYPALRRHPWRLFFVWNSETFVPSTREELMTAKAVIALPFGSHKLPCFPGKSNSAIAEVAYKFLDGHRHLPVYSQWEVPIWNKKDPGKSGRETTTPSYIAELLAVAPQLKGATVVLIAHPWHYPRAKWLLESVGMKVLMPEGINNIPWDGDKGTQDWTKSEFEWMKREIVSRFGLWLLGTRLGPRLYAKPKIRQKLLMPDYAGYEELATLRT